MNLQEIADRFEIEQLLNRYCNVVDDQDWKSFDGLFTDDAELDYSAFGGPVCGVRDLKAFLSPIVASMQNTQHTISTMVLGIDGDQAQARTAGLVMMVSDTFEGGSHVAFSGLWYRDVLIRTADGWRIRKRVQEFGWLHNMPSMGES